MTVTGTRIEASARAGLSNFGSEVAIGSNDFDCNEFDLDGEADFINLSLPYSFDNLGDNTCGCGNAATTCKVVSSSLEPPSSTDSTP